MTVNNCRSLSSDMITMSLHVSTCVMIVIGLLSLINISGLEKMGTTGGGILMASSLLPLLIVALRSKANERQKYHAYLKSLNAPLLATKNLFPDELTSHMLDFLSAEQCTSMRLINKNWNELILDDLHKRAVMFGYTGKTQDFRSSLLHLHRLSKDTTKLWKDGLIPHRFVFLMPRSSVFNVERAWREIISCSQPLNSQEIVQFYDQLGERLMQKDLRRPHKTFSLFLLKIISDGRFIPLECTFRTLVQIAANNDLTGLKVFFRLNPKISLSFPLQPGWTTPLYWAIANQNPHMMRWLIEQKVNPNDIVYENLTPLMFAIQRNFVQGVQELIHWGADLNQRDGSNKTPLMYARQWGCHPSIINILQNAGTK